MALLNSSSSSSSNDNNKNNKNNKNKKMIKDSDGKKYNNMDNKNELGYDMTLYLYTMII